jgi:hypothetical protein
MRASEVSTGDIAVDKDGTVWLHAGTAEVPGGYWRYVEGFEGELSSDKFEKLPLEYEPYTALDLAARSLVHSHIKAPVQAYSTQKRGGTRQP